MYRGRAKGSGKSACQSQLASIPMRLSPLYVILSGAVPPVTPCEAKVLGGTAQSKFCRAQLAASCEVERRKTASANSAQRDLRWVWGRLLSLTCIYCGQSRTPVPTIYSLRKQACHRPLRDPFLVCALHKRGRFWIGSRQKAAPSPKLRLRKNPNQDSSLRSEATDWDFLLRSG